MRPRPTGDLRAVGAVFGRVVAAFDLQVPEPFLGVSADPLQPGRAVDGVGGQTEAGRLDLHSGEY